jgi:hypothetical protein
LRLVRAGFVCLVMSAALGRSAICATDEGGESQKPARSPLRDAGHALAPPPAPSSLAPTAPASNPWPWVLLAASLPPIAAGSWLLLLNGEPTCAANSLLLCPEVHLTGRAGLALVGVGLATNVLGAVLAYRERCTTLRLSLTPSGIVAGGRF